jgi:hypothetical protein
MTGRECPERSLKVERSNERQLSPVFDNLQSGSGESPAGRGACALLDVQRRDPGWTSCGDAAPSVGADGCDGRRFWITADPAPIRSEARVAPGNATAVHAGVQSCYPGSSSGATSRRGVRFCDATKSFGGTRICFAWSVAPAANTSRIMACRAGKRAARFNPAPAGNTAAAGHPCFGSSSHAAFRVRDPSRPGAE